MDYRCQYCGRKLDTGLRCQVCDAKKSEIMITPTKEQIEKIRKEICCKLGMPYSVLFGKKQP